MLDMSRNAVMKIEQVKKIAQMLSAFGYNTLLLYTEDTYEVDGEPYFGLFRGRYTKKELKELDEFCLSINVELIPCVQTLAHLNQIFIWAVYHDHIHDTGDVLLVEEGRTYQLIDNMFKTLRECFSSKNIHIGMDEATQLGRGRYAMNHKNVDQTALFYTHLNKVSQIAERYNFKPMIWSDMIVRMANESEGYSGKEEFALSEAAQAKIPKNLGLVYWSYYGKDENAYSRALKSHKKLKKELWFAGGTLCWLGFSPNNKEAMECMFAAMSACRKEQVDNVMMTMWGDNGKECSYFSCLPSLYAIKRSYDGVTDTKQIADEFEKIVGESFADMLYMDAPNYVGGNDYALLNMAKAMFYTDPLLGYFDTTVQDGITEEYSQAAKRLYALNKGRFGYLYAYLGALCDFLSIKYDLGWRTYCTYKKGDKTEWEKLLADYALAVEKLDVFFDKFRIVWFTENKPHGFEVQEQRIGGLRFRLQRVKTRLEEYLAGKADTIPELEEPRLDYYGNEEREYIKKAPWSYQWNVTATPNIL